MSFFILAIKLKRKVKYINDRLSYVNQKEELTIVILSDKNDGKTALLFAWLLCWTLIGGSIIYYLIFSDLIKQTKLYLFVFLIFWIYFEILVIKGYRWRKYGKELIRINRDGFQIKNDVNGYGKLHVYFLENITIPEMIHRRNSLLSEFDSSYWNRAGDTIKFYYQGKAIKFGKDLSYNEVSKLLKLIHQKINELNTETGAQIN